MKTLALSPVSGYGGHNTSIHRVLALRSLGFQVKIIDSGAESGVGGWKQLNRRIRNRLFRKGVPVSLPDLARDNDRLLIEAGRENWDLIWLERAMTINAKTLHKVRLLCPSALIVGFSPDDMYGRHNQSQAFLKALPEYDAYLTTKTYNVAELQSLGCPRVLFVGNGYDPETFKPWMITQDDIRRLGGDVGFIGTYEPERADFMLELARRGLQIRVWGGAWEKMKESHPNLRLEYVPLYGDDFAKACSAFKINLGFLRKINRDQQTTRSVEIPACGGFMLAERTVEHQEMFVEGREAEFFATIDELHEKCCHYLANAGERVQIAEAGRERCLSSGYDNASRLSVTLSQLLASCQQNKLASHVDSLPANLPPFEE
ncbi:MAG: glycosyltransferase [Chromatiaceae bacterium]|nr:glycosyltransferase [Chromatiaceae bacterium]